MNVQVAMPHKTTQIVRINPDKRAERFLTDLRTILNNGGWHTISVAEITLAHNVNSSYMSLLEEMKCIESRRPPGIKGRGKQYRRLGALANLTVSTLLEKSRQNRREWQAKQKSELLSPTPVADPPELPLAPPLNPSLWAYNRELGLSGPFETEQQAEAHILSRNASGADWQIFLQVAQLKTTITIERQ